MRSRAWLAWGVLVGVLLVAGSVLAFHSEPGGEPVGEAGVVVSWDQEGVALFEVELVREGERVTSGELFVHVNRTGEVLERQAVHPDEEGVYRFTASLSVGDSWRLFFYHGYGFDVANGLVEGQTPSQGESVQVTTDVFALYPDAPDRLNLYGYAAYGVIVVAAVLGIGAVLRRLQALGRKA